MADKSIKYSIKVETNDAVKSVDKLSKETKELTKDTAQLGKETASLDQKIEQSSESMGKAGAAIGKVAVGVLAAVSALKGMEGALSSFERTAGILNRFQGDISEASKRVNGLVSDLELMAAQQKVTEAGLKLTGHEFANLVVAAQEYAAATGGDAVQATEQLVEAMAQGEQGGLKRFGLATEGVTGKIAIQADALTNLERKYGETKSSADTLAGSVLTLGNRFENLSTEFTKAFTEGSKVTSVFEGIQKGSGPLETAMDGLSDAMKGVGVFAANAADAFAVLWKNLSNPLDVKGNLARVRTLIDNIERGLKRVALLELQAASPGDQNFIEQFGTGNNAISPEAKKAAAKGGMSDAERRARDEAARFQRAQQSGRASGFSTRLDELRRNQSDPFGVQLANAQRGGGSADTGLGGSGLAAGGSLESLDKLPEYTQQVGELEASFNSFFSNTGSAAEAFAGATSNAFGVLGSNMSDAINAVVQGEKSMSEALEQLAINSIAQIGEMLVNEGIANVFKGLGRALSSYGLDATAAGLIGVGTAEIAAGIGMGAAAAAMAPSGAGASSQPSASPEAPPPDRSQQREPDIYVVQFNAPTPKERIGADTDSALRATRRRNGAARTRAIGG